MRILFTSMPVRSHIEPTLPLARVLRESGHELLYVTGSDAFEYVEEAGIKAAPAGLESRAIVQTYGKQAAELVGLSADERLEHLVLHALIRIAGRAMAVDLLSIAERWRPDVIVSNTAEFASSVVASALGATRVVHGFGPPPQAGSAGFRRQVDEAVRELYVACGVTAGTAHELADDIYIDIWPSGLRAKGVASLYPNTNTWPASPGTAHAHDVRMRFMVQ